MSFIAAALNLLSGLFVFGLGALLLVVLVTFVLDRWQAQNSVRRNFPVVGRLRSVFEHLGEFFRQYFFAMDREELPFNRAQRNWVARAAGAKSRTIAFGSTRDLTPEGTFIFENTQFPVLDQDSMAAQPILFGPTCTQPYAAPSFFNISAMSYGSLSQPAIKALSLGARKAGIWLNTGEGGISDHHLAGGCDLVFQTGTANYGVRDTAGGLDLEKLKVIGKRPEVKMIELKLAQGAKPGKGGILPGNKVTPEIAAIRGIEEGKDSISPNRHPDIASIEDLLTKIKTMKDACGLPVGFKTVAGSLDWMDTLAQAIAQLPQADMPDFITLDSADGGTGAAPQPLMDYMGLPLRESLPALVDALDKHALRPRVRIIASGKMLTPSQVAWALCVGADAVNCARGFMFSLGCIQALKCNKNTCPTGVTTHRKDLQRGLVPSVKASSVASFADAIRHDVGVIAHSCGAASPSQLERRHVRVVIDENRSESLAKLYPPIMAGETI